MQKNRLSMYRNDLKKGSFRVCDAKELDRVWNDAKSSTKFPIEYYPGGSTQNVLRVAQWLISKSTCTFAGSVANDFFATHLQSLVSKQDSSLPHYIKHSESAHTGVCLALMTSKNDSDRTQLFHGGVSESFSDEHLSQIKIQQFNFFFLEAAFIPVSFSSLNTIVTSTHDKTVAFNLSGAEVVKKYFKEIVQILPFVNYLFGKQKEILILSECLGWKCQSVTEVAQKLTNFETTSVNRVVVVTQGVKPTILCYDDSVSEHPVPVVPKEKIVDMIGSGDAFFGGFMAGLVQGKSMVDCVELGHYASSIVVQHPGCTFTDEK